MTVNTCILSVCKSAGAINIVAHKAIEKLIHEHASERGDVMLLFSASGSG